MGWMNVLFGLHCGQPFTFYFGAFIYVRSFEVRKIPAWLHVKLFIVIRVWIFLSFNCYFYFSITFLLWIWTMSPINLSNTFSNCVYNETFHLLTLYHFVIYNLIGWLLVRLSHSHLNCYCWGLMEHPSSPSGFSGVHVTQSSAYCCLSFFILATVLCVLLRFTATDYTFGIFKFFLWMHDTSPVKLNPTRNYSAKHFCILKSLKPHKL